MCCAATWTVRVSTELLGQQDSQANCPEIWHESDVSDLDRTHTLALEALPSDKWCESEHRDLHNEVLSPGQFCVIPMWMPKAKNKASASSASCVNGAHAADIH